MLSFVGSVNFASAEQPYKEEQWFWAAYTLFRRLIVSIVFSFMQDPSTQSFVFAVFFMLFLALHTAIFPFRSVSGNIVELASLLCLALSSLCTLRKGTLVEAGVVVKDGPAMAVNAQLDELQVFFLFFLPSAAAVVLLATEAAARKSSARLPRLVVRLFAAERNIESRDHSSVELSSLEVGGNRDENADAVAERDGKMIIPASKYKMMEEELVRLRGSKISSGIKAPLLGD